MVASWGLVPVELDPRVSLVVENHPGGLTRLQVAKLMRITEPEVEAIEAAAISKMLEALSDESDSDD